MVVPGTYTVSLQQFDGFQFTELVSPQAFKCVSLNNSTIPMPDQIALDAFNKKVAELLRVIGGADAFRNELAEKIKYLKKAVLDAAYVPQSLYAEIVALELKLTKINKQINGDALRAKYESVSPISIKERVDQISGSLWSTRSAPTETYKNSLEIVTNSFEPILISLHSSEKEIKQIEAALDKYNVPYTPGRVLNWEKK